VKSFFLSFFPSSLFFLHRTAIEENRGVGNGKDCGGDLSGFQGERGGLLGIGESFFTWVSTRTRVHLRYGREKWKR
jgi:hypothetical protein